MEVKNGSNTHSAVMYTGRATGGDWSKTTMATSQTDGATKPTDKTQTHGTPKYRILPKLLSTKRSQKEKNNLGTTGFHVRVSPVATSTPKDKVNGRLVTSHDKVNGCVVTSQEKRAESRAKRRQYLAGECVSPSSSRTVNFPSTPEVKHVESAPKQIQKGLRPCGSPPARPNSSPPARPNDSPVSRRNSSHPARPKGSPVSRPNSSPPVRPNGSPVSRPNSSPPARPNDSPVSRPNSSPPVRPNGSPVSHQNSSPLVRPKGSPVSRPNSSPPIRPNGSPVSRPTGSPPPRPGSSSGVATTSPPVRNIRITNTTAIQDKTTDRTKTAMCKPDMKITTPNNSKSKERTTNKSDIKDTQSNKPHAKTTTTNKSPKKHLTTNTSAIKDRTENTSKLNDKCDSAVIKGVTSQAALPQTKTTKPHMSTDRSLLNSCRSPQTSNNSASVTLSVATEASISPYSGYTGPNTTKTERDQKTAHDSGETESTTTPGHRLLVGRDGGASPRLLHDFVNYNTAMARTVSHNEALSKSATSGGDADWTGSAPEQVGAGKTRMNYTSPDEPRIDVHNDGTSDRRWTSTRVVRSRSDVFSCGHTSRPIVNDCVKLTGESCSSKFGERCRPQLPPPPPPTRASLSADDIDTSRLILLSTRRSFTFSDRNSSLRSSFMQPKSPPSDRTKGDPECSGSKPDVTMSGDTGIYSLPQPQCYSEDTMKAIKQITDKYDTLQRRRLQAMSFRETGRRKPSDRSLASTASGAESDPAIAESAVVSGDRSASTDAVDRTTDDTFDAEEEVSLSAGITQRDIARLELFYGSRDTEVAICRCLADVLFNEKSAGNHRSSPTGWRHTHTGVPLLILNTGRGNRKRDLRVVLAERETAFGLWNEKITYLSNYTSHEGAPAFHTMQHSSRPIGDLVGLRFYDAAAAETFHARFLQMTADPTDELWRVGASGHRKSSTKTRWRLRGRSDASSSKPRTKRDISQPCNFAHVTNVKQLEPGLMSSLADMISRTVARRVVGRSSTSRPSSYSSVASST